MINSKVYNQMRIDFCNKFTKTIKPQLQDYENERKKYHLYAIAGVFLCSFLFASPFLIAVFAPKSRLIQEPFWLNFLSILAVIGLFGLLKLYPYIKKTFEISIKQKIMPIICQSFINLHWRNGFYSDVTLFFHSNLIEYSNAKFDDIFNGEYKNIKYEIIEGDFVSGTGRNAYRVFKGCIVKIDLNKDVGTHTLIKPRVIFKKDSLLGHNVYENFKLKHTQLEDVVFNKNYDVYTDNEIEARYLITPSFMERLNNIKLSFKAENIHCAFYENNLLIGISTKQDLFSLFSLSKPIDEPKQFFYMFEEILSIIKLIDYFKLDEHTGL